MTQTPEMMIVGDGPVAAALAPMVTALGWSPVTATDLDAVREGLGAADAVVVLSHHEGLDAPAIRAAPEHVTAYDGGLARPWPPSANGTERSTPTSSRGRRPVRAAERRA